MFKHDLILASTLTTLVIAGCADTNNSRMPQGKTWPDPSSTSSLPRKPLISQSACAKKAGLVAKNEHDSDQRRAIPRRQFVAEKKSLAEDAIAGINVTQSLEPLRAANEPVNRENYHHFDSNPVIRVAESPVSTFSIDVDTGSYSNVRRMLNAGQLPAQDAVTDRGTGQLLRLQLPGPGRGRYAVQGDHGNRAESLEHEYPFIAHWH